MLILLTDISDMNDDIMNMGIELVPEYRRDKVMRYKFQEDRKRSLAAGLLLNYATKIYSGIVNEERSSYYEMNEHCEYNKRYGYNKNSNKPGRYIQHGQLKYDQYDNHSGLTGLLTVSLPDILASYDATYDYDVTYVSNGKPVYKTSHIHFNLSHAGNYVVCVVSDKDVGIDIEGRRKNALKVARRFFTQTECDWIGDDAARFVRVWTLKEAYAKLTGEGIAGAVSKAEFVHEHRNDYQAVNGEVRERLKENENVNANVKVKVYENVANAVAINKSGIDNRYPMMEYDSTYDVSMYISGNKADNIKIYELNIIKSEYAISVIERQTD